MKIEKMEMFHVKPRWLFLKVILFDLYVDARNHI